MVYRSTGYPSQCVGILEYLLMRRRGRCISGETVVRVKSIGPCGALLSAAGLAYQLGHRLGVMNTKRSAVCATPLSK